MSDYIPLNGAFLLSMAPILLTLLAFLAGFGAVLANRRRLGKATGLAAGGTGVLALGALLNVAWYIVSYNLPVIMRDLEISYNEVGLWFGLAGLVLGAIHLLGFVLLLLSVFAGRAAAPVAPAAAAPYAQYTPPTA
ncbi:MAG: hypothetical protein HOU81_16475 [Hamadaea sp.]|uniref:hypothetical protein n=1 Tax=Hamadaea sp. TaxID=2024425 RepID=UPI001794108A|nr:hypothetical protein [Hamadaea sp.]NUR72412.1 hypothetical protein [Hamadaea sp.]NUT22708.1 hypothetical protein [Hamadaea sp.]